MKDKIDINLRIADVALSLSVKPEEEKLLRDAAAGINDVWSKWRQRFVDKSPTEIRAMVTLLFAKSYLEQRQQNQEAANLLLEFEKSLDSLLLEPEAPA